MFATQRFGLTLRRLPRKNNAQRNPFQSRNNSQFQVKIRCPQNRNRSRTTTLPWRTLKDPVMGSLPAPFPDPSPSMHAPHNSEPPYWAALSATVKSQKRMRAQGGGRLRRERDRENGVVGCRLRDLRRTVTQEKLCDGERYRGNFGMRSHASHKKGVGIRLNFSPGIMPSYILGIGERIAQLPPDVSP